MKEICALKNNIKHCVERVPWAVSDALLTSSIDAGYAHLSFIVRTLGRILVNGICGAHAVLGAEQGA